MAFNTNALTYDFIDSAVGGVVSTKDAALTSSMRTLDQNASAQDMLKIQVQLGQWQAMTNLQSSMVKTVEDAVKGVISKM